MTTPKPGRAATKSKIKPANSRARRVLRALALSSFALAVLGAVVFALAHRVVQNGEREVAASTAALVAGDPREAIVRARRAAGLYVPFAPHVRVAYDRLGALAAAAEKRGDRELALFAWRGVRTAALETRWVAQPHAGDLARANDAIARLSAAAPQPMATRTESAGDLAAKNLEALARDELPRRPWVLALLAGAAVAFAGLEHARRRAVSATGHVDLRRAAAGLSALAVGACVWVVALWRA